MDDSPEVTASVERMYVESLARRRAAGERLTDSEEAAIAYTPCYAVQVLDKGRWRSQAVLIPSLGHTSEIAARRVLVKMKRNEPGKKYRLVYSPSMKPV